MHDGFRRDGRRVLPVVGDNGDVASGRGGADGLFIDSKAVVVGLSVIEAVDFDAALAIARSKPIPATAMASRFDSSLRV